MVHRTYELAGQTVGIRTTSPRFGDWLDHTLSEYRVDAESKATFSAVVPDDDGEERGRRRLNVLYWGTAAASRTLDLAEMARALLGQLEVWPMQDREDALYLGAGLVAANGTRVLIPSPLMFYLHERVRRRAERAGIPLPSRPYVAVDPESGRVIPFRPVLRVPDDAMEQLPAPAGRAGSVPADHVGEPCEVDKVWTVGTTLDHVLKPASRGLTLHNLVGATVNLSRVGSAALEGLAPLVRRASCYAVMPLGRPQIVEALAGAIQPSGPDR